MTIKTKYNIGDKVKFRNPVKYMSDVLVGTIIEINVRSNKRGNEIIYHVDDCRYTNGHKTSVDLRMVTEEEIFGIKE